MKWSSYRIEYPPTRISKDVRAIRTKEGVEGNWELVIIAICCRLCPAMSHPQFTIRGVAAKQRQDKESIETGVGKQ